MRRKRLIGTVVGALLAASIAVAVAYASIPSDTNVFTACMLKNVGTIRLIDPSLPSSSPLSHCSSLETQLAWNQKGQPGAPGLAGATGPAGPAGPAGKDGTNGKDGLNGTNGANGANGKDGAPGRDGAPGQDGAPGKDGVSVVSADAETVPAGTPASAAFDSATGNIHLKVPQGDTGERGDPGQGGGPPDLVESVCPACTDIIASGPTQVLNLTLSPGHYAVFSKLHVSSDSTQAIAFNCFLRAGITGLDDSGSSVPPTGQATVSMQAVVNLETSKVVSVICTTGASGQVLNLAFPKLEAIVVGTITERSQ